MYAISAVIVSPRDWIGTKQIPTFYLDENVQGITDVAHAERIATSIIRATGDADNYVHVVAVKVS
jgi:hypothetical protein